MTSFQGPTSVPESIVVDDHGGHGPIHFRRLLGRADFETPVDFVDYTIVPPGSSIGFHRHEGNEEIYLVARGQPLVTVEMERRRLQAGDTAVVRSQQSHELINDSDSDVAIFVVQVRL